MSEMYRNEGPLWPCGCLVGSPYCDCSGPDDGHDDPPAPVDWPARFRAAGKVVDAWMSPMASQLAMRAALRSSWPELAAALDALAKGPE